MDYPASYRIEYLYDIRLVWASEITRNAHFRWLAYNTCDIILLGDCLF